MKKLLFSLPLLALATLFTYCHKTELPTPVSGNTLDNPATDRTDCKGTCTLNFTADNLNTLNVCGVATNSNPCSTCNSAIGAGSQNIVGVGNFVVNACRPFSIRNTNPSSTWISFDGGNTFTEIPGNGGCVTFTTDANCNVQ